MAASPAVTVKFRVHWRAGVVFLAEESERRPRWWAYQCLVDRDCGYGSPGVIGGATAGEAADAARWHLWLAHNVGGVPVGTGPGTPPITTRMRVWFGQRKYEVSSWGWWCSSCPQPAARWGWSRLEDAGDDARRHLREVHS